MIRLWSLPRTVTLTLTTGSTLTPPIAKLRVCAQLENSYRSCRQPQSILSALRYSHSLLSNMEASTSSNNTDQLVQHGGKAYRVIKEGQAYILNPPKETAASQGTKKELKPNDESQTVFYNPIQQFNRDLSVLAIRAYGEHLLALKKYQNEKRKRRAHKDRSGRNKKRKREEDDSVTEQASNLNSETKPVEEEPQPASESYPEASTPSFTILDALSATGLRALRYASEIPFATSVVANDLSSSAIQSMKLNIEYNQLGHLIRPNNGDACAYMYSLLKPPSNRKDDFNVGKFDVIDLDPYGSAAPFMDAAVQGLKDGGLLCVTCTDAAVWASYGYPEKSFSLYGGVPAKGTHSHEGGLRIILHALAASAAKYGFAIEPLLSLSIDFYARVFVRLHKSPAEVKFISGNTMLVYNCDSGCGAWTTQPLTHTKQRLDKKGNPFYHHGFAQAPVPNSKCEHCGFKTHLSGPMWAGPLHNPHFVQKILDLLPKVDKEIYKTIDRVEGMLITALEEDLSPEVAPENQTNPADEDIPMTEGFSSIIPRVDPSLRESHPFYFSLSSLSKVLHTHTIPADEFRGALRHLGYQCSRSHTKPSTTRTDAPWTVIWEIMREWVRQRHPVKDGALKPGTAGAAIMAKSRESGQKLNSDDAQLDNLKKELISAAENGKDLRDLITKVEAALYRSGSQQVLGKGEPVSQSNCQSGPQKDDSQNTENAKPLYHQHNNTSIVGPLSDIEVIFDESLGREVRPRKRLVRYQMNPRANWGPLNRASSGT